jgi:hypothetical protein
MLSVSLFGAQSTYVSVGGVAVGGVQLTAWDGGSDGQLQETHGCLTINIVSWFSKHICKSDL